MTFNDSFGDQNYSLDISVKDGAFATESFEHLRASMDYSNKLLNIIKMYKERLRFLFYI